MAEQTGVGDLVPRPDPTVRTLDQLATAIAATKELFDARFDAMDKAILLVQQQANATPAPLQVQAQVERLSAVVEERALALKALSEERFRALNQMFRELEERARIAAITQRDTIELRTTLFDEQIKSIHGRFAQDGIAVAAALNAAKDAVAEQNRSNSTAISKSEVAVGEQIRQLQEVNRTAAAGTTVQLDDVRVRLTRIEEWRVVASTNITERKSDDKDSKASNLVVIGLFITVAIAAFSLFFNISKQPVALAPPATQQFSP